MANLDNNAQNVYSVGEKFKIMIPKSGLTSDINGNFNIVGKVKNYPVLYGKAPKGYQNYALTFENFGDELATGNLSVSCNTGKVKVLKVDKETEQALSRSRI